MQKSRYFLLTLLIASIFLSLVSASSNPSRYETYGNNNLWQTHAQFPNSYSNFDTFNGSLISIADGYSETTKQPLVTDFQDGGQTRYVVEQNGNFLNFYDDNLELVSQIATGVSSSQISMTDWNGDGNNNEIVGLYGSNPVQFRVYSFNRTTFQISSLLNQNFSADVGTGVRCWNYDTAKTLCSFLTNANSLSTSNLSVVYNNGTSLSSSGLALTNSTILEAVSFGYFDNNGIKEIFAYDKDSWHILDTNMNEVHSGSIESGNRDNVIARIFYPDLSHTPKIAYAYPTIANPSDRVRINLIVRRLDNSLVYNVTSDHTGQSSPLTIGTIGGMAIADYNYDGKEDVFILSVGDNLLAGDLFRGDNGNVINSWRNLIATLPDFQNNHQQFTIARMTGNTNFNYVVGFNNQIQIINLTGSVIINYTTIGEETSCIPADLNFDGFNDVICSGDGNTYALFSDNRTQSNAVLNSISFSPSSSIQANVTLSVTLSCSDAQGDQIAYRVDCGNGITTGESFSPTLTCLYVSNGDYNLTAMCRDVFHSDFSSASHNIHVSASGSSQGGTGGTGTGGSASINLPENLVNEDGETGLLPSIYHGILGFIRGSGGALFVIIFAIFIVFIILALFGLVRRLADKVGG